MEKLAKSIGLIIFCVAVVAFHYDVKAVKEEIKQEKACIAAADGADELKQCFELMRKNNEY